MAADETFPIREFGGVGQAGSGVEARGEGVEVRDAGRIGEAAGAHEGELVPHHVVRDGAGAGDAVGDVDLVALLDEATEGAAHRDHVVVGMRRKNQHALGKHRGGGGAERAHGRVAGFRLGGIPAAGPAGDRVLHLVKADEVGLIGRSMDAEEILQAGLVVVVVGEFQDGFRLELRKPEDGAAGHALVPSEALVFERADQPRSAVAGESAGGGRVEDVERGGMFLEERGGDVGVDLALDGGADDLGFVLAPSHEDDAAGIEDGAHAHGEGVAWGGIDAAEVAGGVAAGEGVERDEAGERVAGTAGFVEADVTGAADAEDLKIDAAGGADRGFVGGTMGVDLVFGDGARRQVGAGRVEIDVVKKMPPHKRPVALRVLGRERVILVEVEGGDVGEAQALLAVQAHQFGVKADGGGAGREAEDDGAFLGVALADERGDFGGDGARGGQTAGEDGDGGLFVAAAGEEVRRKHGFWRGEG